MKCKTEDFFWLVLPTFCLLFILYSIVYAETAYPLQEKNSVIKLKVTIEGLNDKEKKNALAYLDIEKNRLDAKLNERWLKQLHLRAKDNIKQSLKPFGYYQPVINSFLEQDSNGIWQARYQIDTGPPVKYSKVDVQISGSGAETPEVLAILRKFPIKIDDVLDHDVYETAKTDLLIHLGNLGFSDVKTKKKQLLIDPGKNTVELTLHIDTGEQYYFGQFRFHQSILQPELLNRYLTDIKPGESFSQQRLLAIQQSLIRSGYFSVVDIKPNYNDAEDQHVSIDIGLTQAKRHKFSFGLGYDTEIDLNASIRWQNRLLNSSGHNSDILLKVSEKKSLLRGTYWIPVYDPRTNKIGLTLKLETEETDNTDRETLDLEAAWLTRWRHWDTKLFTEYKYERFEAGSEPDTSARLFSIGSRVEGVFIDKNAYPRNGWSAFAELRGAPEIIWSDTDYLRLHVKSRYLLPVQDKGRLIFRGELGLAEVGDFDKYPNSLRFFAGGDQSVRGYDWKSLGPVDEYDDVIGGKNIITGSIEYNYKIHEQWVAALFLDAGNSYNNNLNKLYYGAGFGGRWISPIGMVRTDLGWPINEDDKATKLSSLVFYLGFEVSL